jgi:hypothetical protein
LVSQRHLVLCNWGGELLLRDNVDKRKRKKRLIRLQVHPCRYRLTGIILPVRKYLQALAPQTFSPHSETTSAVSFTWYILAGIITPVGLYLSVFTCGEKACIAKQKKRYG